jgi:hypothetical protein
MNKSSEKPTKNQLRYLKERYHLAYLGVNGRSTKMDFNRQRARVWTGSGKAPVAGFRDHENELSNPSFFLTD